MVNDDHIASSPYNSVNCIYAKYLERQPANVEALPVKFDHEVDQSTSEALAKDTNGENKEVIGTAKKTGPTRRKSKASTSKRSNGNKKKTTVTD